MSNNNFDLKFTKEDYLKAEIIRLRKENEKLKREKIESKKPMCSCGHGRVLMKGMCDDCCSDYGI